MNLKVTLGLILLLVGLGSYAYFVEHLGSQREEKEEQLAKELFGGVAFDSVARYEITSSGETIVIERVTNPDYPHDSSEQGKVDAEGRALINVEPTEIWMITSPVKAEANAGIISSIRNALANSAIAKEISDDANADLKPFGLDPPAARISFYLDGKANTVLIGKKSPVGNTLYVKLADSPRVVQLSSTSLSYNAVKSVEDLREKKLFPRLTLPDIPRFTVIGERGKFIFARAAEDNKMWNVVYPIERRVEKGQVENILRGFTIVSAEEFIDENPEEYDSYGLTGENLTRVIMERSAGRSTNELIIGHRAENEKHFYARRSDSKRVVTIDEKFVDRLDFTIEDLYSKLMTEIVANDIFSFEVLHGEESYWLRMGEDGRFYLDGNPDKPVEVAHGKRLINRFKNMRAEKAMIYSTELLNRTGLTAPQFIVKLYDVNDSLLDQISIGNPVPDSEGQLYGRNLREDFLYTIKDKFLELFPPRDKIDSILQKPKKPISDSPAPAVERDENGLAITPPPDTP